MLVTGIVPTTEELARIFVFLRDRFKFCVNSKN